MKGHRAKFGRKWEAAIVALLTQPNVDAAARSINLALSTLLRWMKDPEFKTALLQAQRLAFGQSIARLQQAASAAATTILKAMVDPATPPSVKVRAADSMFAHASKAIEIEDIGARLRA